jgi:hypothetical protein
VLLALSEAGCGRLIQWRFVVVERLRRDSSTYMSDQSDVGDVKGALMSMRLRLRQWGS